MQVFKAFAKIAGKKKFSALLYIGIFMIISILMANQSAKDNNFKETKLSICIIDTVHLYLLQNKPFRLPWELSSMQLSSGLFS